MNTVAENKRLKAAGFTLIEVLIASILIGIAIAALMTSNRAFTMANGAGIELSTAEFLVEEIKELTAPLPVVDPEPETAVFGAESGETLADYDDLSDFDGAAFSPPIDVSRQPLNNFSAFSQQVIVENVSASDFTAVVGDHGSDFVRVTSRVLLNGGEISSTSWIRSRQ